MSDFVVKIDTAKLSDKQAAHVAGAIHGAVMRELARRPLDLGPTAGGRWCHHVPPGMARHLDSRTFKDSAETGRRSAGGSGGARVAMSIMCPSARCHEGAVLLGIVLPDGRVAFAEGRTTVDCREFVSVATSEGRRAPERRFRFSSPCAQGGCRQWTGTACGVIAGAMDEARAAGYQALRGSGASGVRHPRRLPLVPAVRRRRLRRLRADRRRRRGRSGAGRELPYFFWRNAASTCFLMSP